MPVRQRRRDKRRRRERRRLVANGRHHSAIAAHQDIGDAHVRQRQKTHIRTRDAEKIQRSLGFFAPPRAPPRARGGVYPPAFLNPALRPRIVFAARPPHPAPCPPPPLFH